MVTAAQLQILQSPIANLVSTISASVNVKLDDSNYLNWNFQIQLLLESNGIFGFVDGSQPCPVSSTEYGNISSSSCSTVECDERVIWKMHDRAIMQLITATLSPVAMSCAIGSTSSKDLWQRLKEQFSTVSKTSIFQLKSNLQNIRKGSDSISQYLLKIKEARDYLSAAGVFFAEEDIVILALNGLPAEYNTFRCVVRGRENVITLKEFRSQLLAEELIVENSIGSNPSYLAAMNTVTKPNVSRGQQDYNSFENGGYRSFNRNRGRGRYNSGQRGPFNSGQRGFFPRAPMNVRPAVAPITPSGGMSVFPSGGMGSHNSAASGAFSPTFSNGPYNPSPGFSMIICQLCNKEGHSATACGFRGYERTRCNLCGKPNHTTWYCYYNESGPNFMGHGNGSETNASLPTQHQAMYTIQNPFSPLPQPSPQAAPPVWITDSGATNHMTLDLSNLTASTSYPSNDSVQTANGEGQSHREAAL